MDWSSLGGVGIELLRFLSPVVASVLVLVLTALVKRWLDKLGIERSVRIDDMIDKYVTTGVSFAERAAQKQLDGKKYTSQDKLALATSTVLTELEQSGVKGVAEELIRARIETYLSAKDTEKKV